MRSSAADAVSGGFLGLDLKLVLRIGGLREKVGGQPRGEDIMNSRERVLAALNHREPDRVPVDFSGHRSSGIAAIAYAKLRKFLALKEKPIRVYDSVQQLAIVDEDVLQLFGVDTIELGRAFALRDDCWAEWELPDGTPCQMPTWALPERGKGEWVVRSKSGKVIARMPDGALFFEESYFPLADERRPKTIKEAMAECMWTAMVCPPGPLVEGTGGLDLLSRTAQEFRAMTNRAIIGLFGGNLFEMGQFLYKMDGFLAMLAGEPLKAHKFLDELVDLHLANLERFLAAVGNHLDIILFGDDLGMQTGPMMSPKMYREFFKPRHRLMWTRAKQLADVKVMLHCCGGIHELMPDLIDAGLDAVNPVQISCRGMAAEELKAEFGKEMVFWGGGCDTQNVLPFETPEGVRKHVREQVSKLRAGGGFVFQQVHNIMANVPPENVVAMLEAVNSSEG
jgi:uroporphyrinogen decarboxylase